MRRCAAFSVFLAGCLFPSVGDLTGGSDGGTDAFVESGGDASTGPITLAQAGSVDTETGNAQQTHVIWAAGSKRWWLFYIDDDTVHLKTRTSPDFVTWTDGAALTLSHPTAGEGRNFSVSYASIAGADVVHLAFSHAESQKLSHTHARAIVSGATITWGSPIEVCQDANGVQGPDGTATIVTTSGDVWDSSGFIVSQGSSAGYYNEDVFRASTADTGGSSWSPTFAQTTIEIVNTTANARAFVQGVAPIALWEAGDDDPSPANVRIASFTTSWSSPVNVFPTDAQQDPNDWGAAALSNGELHVVRAKSSGGYDHVLGTISIATATAPPGLARTSGSGVVLLADGSHLAAFDLASDGSVQESRWTAPQWSAWITVAPARTRAFLSGYCPDLDAHPEATGCALIWSEPASGGHAVVGTLVQVR